MIRVENSVVVNCSPEEAFAIATKMERWPEWNDATLAVMDYEGPPTTGTTYTEVTSFLGRKMEADYLITTFEPGRKLAMKTASGPIYGEGYVTFEPVAGGTKITEFLAAEPGKFFRLVGPLLAKGLKRQRAIALNNLKALIEAEAGGASC